MYPSAKETKVMSTAPHRETRRSAVASVGLNLPGRLPLGKLFDRVELPLGVGKRLEDSAAATANGLQAVVEDRAYDPALGIDPIPGRHRAEDRLLEAERRHLAAGDVDLLEKEGYMTQVPSSASKVVTVAGFDYHTYLWLFRKETSAGGGSVNDARKAVLFKLTNARIIEGTTTVELTYGQIL